MRQLTGKIVSVRRDDEKFSSARIIFATIETEDGDMVPIEWANIYGENTFGFLAKLYGMDFENAWKNAKEGLKVQFVMGIQGFSLT